MYRLCRKERHHRPAPFNSVQHLLHNRRYIGEYAYRDIVVPDGIPAIVPQDLFDRVQEKLAKNKVSAEFITFWLHRFRKLDVRQQSHRKMLIDTFVNAIFLYDDRMVITCNYKEGTSTVTLDDVKAAGQGKHGFGFGLLNGTIASGLTVFEKCCEATFYIGAYRRGAGLWQVADAYAPARVNGTQQKLKKSLVLG